MDAGATTTTQLSDEEAKKHMRRVLKLIVKREMCEEEISRVLDSRHEIKESLRLENPDLSKRALEKLVDVSVRSLVKELKDTISKMKRTVKKKEALLLAGGHDATFVYKAYVRAVLSEAAKDEIERRLAEETTRMLDRERPIRRVRMDPSALLCVSELEERSENDTVDVLVREAPLGKDDINPPQINVFDEYSDSRGVDEASEVLTDCGSKVADYLIPSHVLNNLKVHQTELVRFCLKAWSDDGGVLAAHSMGLGKSLSLLAAFSIYAVRFPRARALVVSPVSMIHAWVNEVHKWSSLFSFKVQKVTSRMTKTDVGDAIEDWTADGGLLVIGHHHFVNIVSDSVGFLRISSDVIFAVDEAHILKNASSQMYAAFSKVTTKKRVFLTGSPLQNNLKEYFAMVQLISPGLLGDTVAEFDKTFGRVIAQGMLKDSTDEEVSKSERMVQVLRWSMANVMHERSANLLLNHIPAKTEYRLMHPCDAVDPSVKSAIDVYNVTQEAALAHRVTAAIALIDSVLSDDPENSILIFSHRKATLRALQSARDGLFFDGTVSTDDRPHIVQQFNAEGGILYITTQAGGVGLTLTRANHVVILDPSWNPVYDAQAIARAWRIGQARNVTVYRMVAEGTIEECVYRRGVQKLAMAGRIMDESAVNRVFTAADLAAMADNEPCSPLAGDALLQHPILNRLPYTIYCHDAFFLGESASLEDTEKDAARNELNAIKAQKARHIPDADGVIQLVNVGHTHFPRADSTGRIGIVPACTPTYSNVDGLTITLDNRGPSIFFEPQYRFKSKKDWISLDVCKTSSSVKVVMPCPGTFIFRMRTIADDYEAGPWSDESVPISVSAPPAP